LKVFETEFSKYKIGSFDESGSDDIKHRLKTVYEFEDKSMIILFCLIHGDKEKKRKNYWDAMRVTLLSSEVVKAIIKKHGREGLYN